MCSVGLAPEKISSLQNPRVKLLVKLRDRRPRDEAGVFLVEGYREIRRALREDIDRLENKLLVLNLLAGPLVIGALGLWFHRNRKK